MLSGIKSKLIKEFINSKIKRYGRMLSLNLDSKNKNINLNVMLAGEETPLELNIGNYKIVDEDGRYFIVIDDVSTSRLWLNILAEETLNGQRLEIPSKIAKLLKVVA